MSKSFSRIWISGVALLLVAWVPTAQAVVLQNGDMEDPSSYSVCPGWTFYKFGTLTGVSQNKELTVIHSGTAAQKLSATSGTGSAGAYFGIRQTIAATPGDAFTFGGWVWNDAISSSQETSVRVDWAGLTDASAAAVLGTFGATSGTRRSWQSIAPAGGNATASNVTVFLHTRRVGNANLLTYWDDVVGYRAYLPPAPLASTLDGTSAAIDVQPGDNEATAQFAISVGGGGYTLGTNFVQADGSIGSAPVWRTDSAWDTVNVNGLVAGTTYDFAVEARYSATYSQATWLGPIASVPEPATLFFLIVGWAALIRRR